MFYGLIVKHNRKQAKPTTLLNSVKLSQAVLEPSKSAKELVSVLVEYDDKEFILCVLEPGKTWQSTIDIAFESGCEVKFFLRGSGTVHLTGYELFDPIEDLEFSVSEEEEITSQSDDDAAEKKIMTNRLSAKKSPKAIGAVDLSNKKQPNKREHEDDDEDDDDDSDDEDFDLLGSDSVSDLDTDLDSDNDDEDDEDDDEDEDEEGDEDEDEEDEEMSDDSVEIEEIGDDE